MSNRFDDKQLYPLLFQDDFTKVEAFLDKYGLDSVDGDGRSFLMTAIAEHKNQFARQLIDMGADINQPDDDGSTPLHAAVRAKNLEMIDLLFSRENLERNLRDESGKNALGVALDAHPKDNELLLRLVEAGIDPFAEYNDGRTPYSVMLKFHSGEITIGGVKLDITPVISKVAGNRQ